MGVCPDNALVVQSDCSVLLDLHSPRAAKAREAIAPFAELVKSPEHVHTYRLTPLSIWNARAAGLAAGLALAGQRPVCAIYSTFLQRAYDQVVHDVAIQRLPVRFAIDRAGMVGADGVTHHGSYDISYLGCLPGFVLMAAADEAELMHMVATAAGIDDRPSALRFPRGEGTGVDLPVTGEALEIGRGRILREARESSLSQGHNGTTCERSLAAISPRRRFSDALFPFS